MILDQRVFHGSTDISTTVNDFRTGAYTFAYQAGQYLYIGSILPFNNMFVELGTVNDVAATVSVDIWWANAWHSAVDIIDETSGLFSNGRIQWNTNRLKGWDHQLDSADVTGLSSTVVYNMYWARFSWSATLKATTTLKYIGQKFSTDDILYSFYPDMQLALNKESFETGKTTWDEQHYMAAEHIVRDLKKSGVIDARAQILDYSLFIDASCHKVAEIVYTAFGSPYIDQLKIARDSYKEAMKLKNFRVDINATGTLEPVERVITTQFGTR